MAINSFIKVFSRPAVFVSRLRGVFVVAAGGAAIFAAMHFVLAFSLGADAAAIYPRQRPLGWLTYERIWGRISAIDQLYRTGQLPPDTRLGTFLGVSTSATGIERQFLDARATTADRWIVLSGAGLSFENIENVMYPVFFCGLKPTTVAFGVHPQMLVGEPYIGDEPTVGLQQRVVGRRRRARQSPFADLHPLSWLRKHWVVRRRALAADFLNSRIYGLRLYYFYLLGIRAEWLCQPTRQPWDENPLWLWNLDDAENEIAHDQVEFWSRRGHFKAENYDPDGDQARSFVRMIRAYRKLGAKVYVVIMPLRSTVRNIIPPNAKPCLLDVLHREFPEAPPTVIDMQEAIPDVYFTDEAHLSQSGAERLSTLVAERLRAPSVGSPTQDGP